MKAITYKLVDLFGAEIRSRSNIEKIRRNMSDNECYQIDLSCITFVSRSVADELCDMEEHMKVRLYNISGDAKNMIEIVSKSRKVVRAEKKTESNAYKCLTMEDMNNIFATID